jgi:hypothetical protein
LTFGGSQTRLGAALSGVRQELAGLPVAGLVMVSDGADTADAALSDALLGLKAEGLPVFTVGVGQETLSKDIQVGRIVTPKTTLKGTTLMVDVVLSQSGFDGQQVTLDVEDEGTLVSTQQVTLPDAGTPASIPVRFTVSEAGPRVLRFRVSPQPGELVTENNAREALIDVRDRKRRSYFEGAALEMKLSAATGRQQPDSHRAAADRRQQVPPHRGGHAGRTGDRLPEDARGAVLVSRPRARQHRGRRVHRRSAADDRRVRRSPRRRPVTLVPARCRGAARRHRVADVLPVVLRSHSAGQGHRVSAHRGSRPRRQATAVTQIVAANEAASAERWKHPARIHRESHRRGQPGATVLLTGTDERRRDQVVLAFQRYGRGKALAFPVQDSWHWQMDARMSVQDLTHENYWRQLLRWLVDGVPDAVDVHTLTERVEPGVRPPP